VRLPPFRLVEPESLPEAIDALGRLDGEARLVAGGTALVAMIRLGLVKPDRLVSLHRVPALDEIRVEDGSLTLGAMATHADIERSRIVRDGWPLLAEAVRRVATPAIRTSGTIGGNLAYAEAASDPAPALLCLDAEVRVVGPSG
jgi:carbon-monoxide dehydrogenase medium subunit